MNWNKIQKGDLLQCQEGTIVAYIGKNKKNNKKFKGLVIDNNLNKSHRFKYSKNMRKKWFKEFKGEIDVVEMTHENNKCVKDIIVVYELVK